MSKIFVTPAEGKIVRDPVTLVALPAAGAVKDSGSFWLRRELDVDVTISDPPKTKAPAKEDK
jgi:hypothetical protein